MKNIFILEGWNLIITNLRYILKLERKLLKQEVKTQTTYDWFPKKAKKFYKSYKYPVFPEDFAYYLLKDNNTLILVSAFKDYNQNLTYDIKKKELGIQNNRGKLNFIISTYAQNCGHKSLKNKFECNLYKPLISKNLINSIE